MPDKDDKENIDRMFSEIMSSNSIEGLNEKQEETIMDVKGLLIIQESLMDTMLMLNSLIYRTYLANAQDSSEELQTLLSYLYQSSEDFYSYFNHDPDGIIEDENAEENKETDEED
jgi:hypothetical protein